MDNEKKTTNQRPPIVVVMGHIDHGKSKLLDYIRNANVVEKEAGGITQHIGAYEAEVKCEHSEHGHKTRKISFLDTPGHEAFSQMRNRGARIADVAILVVAADEGIKPQTTEAYKSIQEAKIPFVVALNKMDKPGANPEQVKGQLAEMGVYVENYGGTVPCINISAKTGDGVEELLDIVLLLSDLEDLSSDKNQLAIGFVIESHMDPQRGTSATIIIQNGSLKKGQFVATGSAIAPVRIFEDFKGKSIDEACCSSPVKIVGFSNLPPAGSEFKAFNTKKEAEEYVSKNKTIEKVSTKNGNSEGKSIVVPIIIKSDVSGSLEAIEKEINKIKKDDVFLNILRQDIGTVSEDDAKLASSGKDSIILGFNVEADSSARSLIEKFGILIFTSNIIYKLSEWLEEEIEKRRTANIKEKIIGTAKILKTFSQNKNKQLVGGRVLEGKLVVEKHPFRIKRNDEEIGMGRISGLQQNKAEVREVEAGKECGIMTDSKITIEGGDLIEIFEKL